MPLCYFKDSLRLLYPLSRLITASVSIEALCHAWSLGLFKKHQLWKLKVGRVVSHGFIHAEFDGARKNRFQALLGVANSISNF